MSYIRDAIIRLGVELQQPTISPPNLGPIIEQEKRLASIYKERASAAVSAETTIRGEYQKTVAVLREIVGLERSRGQGFGRGGGGFSGGGFTQVGDQLVTATGGGRSGSSNGRGAPTAASYAGFVPGSVAGGGMGGWGGSSRFMGTYGNYTPSAPASAFTPGSVGAGGSRGPGGAQWLMGSYGAEPMAPPAAAAARGGRGGARGPYDPRNSQFNTGNAFWDRARNRFGYGPFDAIGNQLRGWGGAVGMGVGMYAGSAFGDLGMIAGAATGQMVGQGVGYMATTGVGRQTLLRGAEAVATSGFGRGVAGGLGGAAAYSGLGFLGAGAGYSVGAAALPVAALAAVGYGGNRFVNAVGNRMTQDWARQHGQDAWNNDPNAQMELKRSQLQIRNINERGNQFADRFADASRRTQNGVFGQEGFGAADVLANQRNALARRFMGSRYFTEGDNSTAIGYRMRNAPEMAFEHISSARRGIAFQEWQIGSRIQEAQYRQQGTAMAIQSTAAWESARDDVRAERERIRGAEAAIGGASGREKAEFNRITSAIQQGARINVEDLSILEAVAGSDYRVKDYVERERRKYYREEGTGAKLDATFGKGDPALLEAQDREDRAYKGVEENNPLRKSLEELQDDLKKFIEGTAEAISKHQAEIDRLIAQLRSLGVSNPGG